MNTKLLPLLGLSALLFGACSQDKTAETATTTETTTTTSTATPTAGDTAVVFDNAEYRAEADRLAGRVVRDMRLTDTVVVHRVTKAYYNRGRRLQELDTRYATDTTGRYTAVRTVNEDTDREVSTALGNPEQASTYTSNRASYYREETRPARPRRRGPAIVKYESKDGETKIEYANGTKVKIEKDGDRKIKRADGSKVKYDEDGRKAKP